MRSAAAIGSAALLAGAFAIGGCSEGGLAGNLRAAGIRTTPDEFLVLPTRPLEMPQDLSALPPPEPGTVNRVAYQPRAEAIAGLTGRPATATANGAALVASAGPADPQIRPELASEDAEWRATHRGLLLERWFSRDRERLTYRDMTLDAAAEFERQRAMGRRVPPVPPSLINPEG